MLLTFEPAQDGSQDVEGALELVEATAWDGPLAAVRTARTQVFRLLAQPEPVPLAAAAVAAEAGGQPMPQWAAGAGTMDENASYAALLTHTARGM